MVGRSHRAMIEMCQLIQLWRLYPADSTEITSFITKKSDGLCTAKSFVFLSSHTNISVPRKKDFCLKHELFDNGNVIKIILFSLSIKFMFLTPLVDNFLLF